MTLLSTQKQNKPLAQLNADDWISAALNVLVDAGIEAVQITSLAKALKVSRGSFYWHFKSRAELLEALIEEWRARNTGVMSEAVSTAASLSDGILNLFHVWVDHQRFDPALDQAVRDWARRSTAVNAILSAEDASRVHSIAAFYEQCNYPPNEAFIRARIIYFTQLSYFALGIKEPFEQRMRYLESYFLCFTGQPIATAVAATFKQQLSQAEDKQ